MRVPASWILASVLGVACSGGPAAEPPPVVPTDGAAAPSFADVLRAHAARPEDREGLAQAVDALGESPLIELVASAPIALLLADGTEPDHQVHPQGLAWVEGAGVWVLTAVEIIEARERTSATPDEPFDPAVNGRGKAWLFVLDAVGRPRAERTMALPSDEATFHPGGADAVAGAVYLPVSPYYPNSRADIVRVDVTTDGAEAAIVASLEDHLGIVTYDQASDTWLAGSWDALRWYGIGADGAVIAVEDRATDLAAQDGQSLGSTGLHLWTGLGASATFGLDLVRADGSPLEVIRSIRWPRLDQATPRGNPPFQNATHLWVDEEITIWALCVPDDQHGRYATRPHGASSDDPERADAFADQATSLHLYRIRPSP
jgi:hypothetical protein